MTAATITVPSVMPAAVSVVVDFDEDVAETVIDGIDWYIQRFTELASRGGFATAWGGSSCVVKQRNVVPRRYATVIAADQVDVRCFLVLYFGIRAQIIGHHAEAARNSISSNEPNHSFGVDEFLASTPEPYPPLFSELQRVTKSGVVLAGCRSVIFHATSALTPSHLAVAEQTFGAWNDVAILAFPRSEASFESGQEFMINASFDPLDDRTISIQIDDFECHDSAINPIVLSVGSMLHNAGILSGISVS